MNTNQKANISNKAVARTVEIPPAALAAANCSGKALDFYPRGEALVVLKRQMTAYELISAVDSLQKLAFELTDILEEICGKCGDCENCCPIFSVAEAPLDLPDYLREEAGIPLGAKLCATVDRKTSSVRITEAAYQHDLKDIPSFVMEDLEGRDLCLAVLEKHLMDNDVIFYGD